MTTQSSPLRGLAFALALAATAACGQQPETTSPETAQAQASQAQAVGSYAGYAIARLDVGPAPALQAANAQRFAALGVGQKIQAGASSVAHSGGRWDPAGPLVITVQVDEFRLRTSANVAWMGVMSGGDYIGAVVYVSHNGQVLKQYKVTAVSVKGGMIGNKEDLRLGRLVDELNQKIIAGI